MNDKDFDNLIREKFEKSSLKKSVDGWEQLSKRLPSKLHQQKWLTPFRLVAALLLLIGLSAGVLLFTKNDYPLSETIGIAPRLGSSVAVATQTPPRINAAVTNKPQNREINLKQSSRATSLTVIKPLRPLLNGKSFGSFKDPVAVVQYPAQLSDQTTNDRTYFLKNNSSAVTVPSDKLVFDKGPLKKTLSEEPTRNPFLSFVKPGESANTATSTIAANSQNTSIDINGGMNYGRLNTGYSVGVSASHSFKNRLFIEGAVAFLYNNQAPDISNYPGPATTPSRPSSFVSNSATSPSLQTIPSFYYLQINPSIGYKVNKVLSVSVGGDLQERIADMSQNGTAVVSPRFDPKIIPQLDLGYTGKATFSINPKIETAILFRNGLNNLLQSQSIYPYFNRQYFELQLKYRFRLKHN